MSGIFGFALMKNDSGNIRCESILKRMRQALPVHTAVNDDWHVSEDGRVGLGAIHAVNIGHPKHFAYDRHNQLVCFLDGYIFSDAQYPKEIAHNKSGAEYLLKRYLEAGPTCVKDISGSFNVAWYDKIKDRLVLATDKIGQRLLFYGNQNGNFIFASYIARIMAGNLVSPEIDVESLSDFLRISYVCGEGTLFKDIKCMPEGSILSVENGEIKVQKYWGIDQIEPHGSYNGERLDEIEALFKTAVARTMSSGVNTAIGLTGGLDSRCILAAAANMKLPFITYTGGQENSTDVIFAKQSAETVGYEHFFEFIGPEKMTDWLLPMVQYQGGVVATLHSHPCQHFDMSFPFNAYIQGVAPPSYVHGRPWYPAHFDIYTKNEVVAEIKRAISSANLEKIGFKNIWREKYKSICTHAFDKHLNFLLEHYEVNDKMMAFADFYMLGQDCRKLLNKANMIVRNVRENFFPYLDHEFISALAGLPIKERVTSRIQVDLIKRLSPKLLNVPLSKTMQPIPRTQNPGWIAENYSQIQRRIARKLGISKNIKFEPNHYLYRWSRQEMRESLTKILLNPKAAFREYLEWQKIEPIVNQHFDGRHNWETVIGALVVFEICHHLWVDDSVHKTVFKDIGQHTRS